MNIMGAHFLLHYNDLTACLSGVPSRPACGAARSILVALVGGTQLLKRRT